MLIGLIVILLGLFLAFLLVQAIFKDKLSIPKVVVYVSSIYLSSVVLIGHYMDHIGIPLTLTSFFALFMAVTIIVLLYLKEVKLDFYTEPYYLLGFLSLLVGGFIYLIYPSLPSFYPLGNVADAPRHFALIQYIQENGHWAFGTIYELSSSGSGVIDTYPYGMHLNIALLSSALDVSLIKFLFPFCALMTALSAAALYGIAVETLEVDKKIALFSGFFLITNIYVLDALTYTNSYASIFAGFLSVVFFWILTDYSKREDAPTLLLLILLQSAIILSYPSWAVITLVMFLIVNLFLGHWQEKMKQSVIFISGSFFLTAIFWMDKFSELRMRLGETGIFVEETRIALEGIMLLLAAVGLLLYGKKHRILYSFIIGVFVMPLFLFLYKATGASVSLYWFNKTYFFAAYPLAIFASLGLGKVTEHWLNISDEKTKDRGKLIILLFLLTTAVYFTVDTAEDYRWRKLSITPEEYVMGKWMRDNLSASSRIIYIDPDKYATDRPFIYWTVSLSRYGVGSRGNIVLIKNIDGVPLSVTNELIRLKFIPIYELEDIMILQGPEISLD